MDRLYAGSLTAEFIRNVIGSNWVDCTQPKFRCTGLEYHLKNLSYGQILIIVDRENWSEGRRERSGQASLEMNEIVRIARKKGAVGIASISPVPVPGLLCLTVRNTRALLLTVAEAVRRQFRGPVIAVTGTAGKSSTVGMLNHVLNALDRTVVSNPGYQNTLFGVASALTSLGDDSDVVVLECAISGFARFEHHVGLVARPTISIITSIAAGQMDLVASEHDTAIYKGRIFESLAEGGVAVLNGDTRQVDYLRGVARAHASELVEYGRDAEEFRFLGIELLPDGQGAVSARIAGETMQYRVPLPSEAIAYNSLGAIAALSRMGIEPRESCGLIASAPLNRRTLEIGTAEVEGRRFTYIDDSRNATLPSIQEALRVLPQVAAPNGRRIIVIGGIVDMGRYSESIHRNLAQPVLSSAPDLVFCYGDLIVPMMEVIPPSIFGGHSSDPSRMAQMVLEALREGDTVLIKGSHRNTRMRDVADAIKAGRLAPSGGRAAETEGPHEAPAVRHGITIPEQIQQIDASSLREASVILGGDTSLGDAYLQNPKREVEGRRLENAPLSFFEDLRRLLAPEDICVLNLETVLLDRPEAARALDKQYVGWDRPGRTLDVLGALGVKGVCLANNHTKDYGAEALAEMVGHLKNRSIATYGVGNSVAEAAAPLRIRVASRNVYLLGGMAVRRRYRDDLGYYATDTTPGINPLERGRLAAEIAALRARDAGGLIVVTPHWGDNYRWASDRMRELGHDFITAGADLVVGHGPHMIGEIEALQRGLTVFSLGNFVFNSPGRYEKFDAPPYSFVARLMIGGAKQVSLRLYPFMCDNRRTGYRSRPVEKAELAEIFSILREKSRDPPRFDAAFSLGDDPRGPHVAAALPERNY